MTDIEVLEREKQCVQRKGATNCSDCAHCDLLMDEAVILATYDRAISALRESVQAEQDGWLVVLPCKVGDILYRISKNKYQVHEIEVDKQYISTKTVTMFAHPILPDGRISTSYEVFCSQDIGKTIFLTPEEAETAFVKKYRHTPEKMNDDQGRGYRAKERS